MINKIKALCKNALYLFPSSGILMFHHVTANPDIKKSGCVLDGEKFYSFFNEFSEYATLEDTVNNTSKHKIAVTFDDGLEDLYTIAYPFLKSKNIPFTAFIVYDFLDTPGYITTEQLLELSKDPLVTIGSHGMTHSIIPGLSDNEKKSEFAQSQKLLSDKINKPVEIFAYSHGQYDKKSLEYVKSYKYAMSVKRLPANSLTIKNKYTLPRINVYNTVYDNSLLLIKKIFRR